MEPMPDEVDMPFHKLMIPLLLLVFLLPADPVAAQKDDSGRYGTWESGEEKLQKLTGEVEALIAEGIRSKAAHPEFFRDLQLTVNKYKIPKKTVYFKDDFSDNEYLRNPAWTVKKGVFSVDYQGSLYSSVIVYRPKPVESVAKETAPESTGDKNLRILFGVLDELTKDPKGREQEVPGQVDGEPAQIISLADIPNACTLKFTLQSESEWGQISIGLFQGTDTSSGYHLVYHAAPSKDRPLQLIKYLRGKPYVVNAAAETPILDDGRPHAVLFSRTENGDMVVRIDDRDVLQGSDLAYRKNFSGLTVTNSGGKYSIDNIEVYTEK